jgi:hypothetical protein
MRMCEYRRFFGADIGFIAYFYTQFGTISKYSAIAVIHTLQITTAYALFQSDVSSQVVAW